MARSDDDSLSASQPVKPSLFCYAQMNDRWMYAHRSSSSPAPTEALPSTPSSLILMLQIQLINFRHIQDSVVASVIIKNALEAALTSCNTTKESILTPKLKLMWQLLGPRFSQKTSNIMLLIPAGCPSISSMCVMLVCGSLSINLASDLCLFNQSFAVFLRFMYYVMILGRGHSCEILFSIYMKNLYNQKL